MLSLNEWLPPNSAKANCIKKAAGESVNPGGRGKSPFSP